MSMQLRLRRCVLSVCFLLMTLSISGCGSRSFLFPAEAPPPSAKAERIVSTAYKQVGRTPYRLGGASPQRGFDCSGLIWWAYKENGVKIPRITVDQARAGVRIPSSKAQPGDIVVFRTGSSPRGLHTGIYAGSNSFIHSPRKGQKVRLESLDVPHWKNKLIAVRRIL